MANTNKQPSLMIEENYDEAALNAAILMIDMAEQGILVDESGKVLFDLRNDFIKMQNIFDNIEWKRLKSEKNKDNPIDIQISVKDIKAVLFKPIIEMEIDNNSSITGRSVFSTWWKQPYDSMYNNLYTITFDKIRRFLMFARNRIESFYINVLDNVNNIPEFLDRLLDSVPTALGGNS